MAFVGIRVDTGRALRYIQQVRTVTERFARSSVVVGTPLPYGFGIETGLHRNGSLARRAGGAYMMQKGLADAEPEMRGIILAAYQDGDESGVIDAEGKIGDLVISHVQGYTPVKTGALRASFTFQPTAASLRDFAS